MQVVKRLLPSFLLHGKFESGYQGILAGEYDNRHTADDVFFQKAMVFFLFFGLTRVGKLCFSSDVVSCPLKSAGIVEIRQRVQFKHNDVANVVFLTSQ